MKIQGTALIKTKTLQQQDNPSFLELASARGSLPPLCSQSVSVKPKLTGLLFSQSERQAHTTCRAALIPQPGQARVAFTPRST